MDVLASNHTITVAPSCNEGEVAVAGGAAFINKVTGSVLSAEAAHIAASFPASVDSFATSKQLEGDGDPPL